MPPEPIDIRSLPPLPGHFDGLHVAAASIEVHGWILGVDSRMDALTLFADGQPVGPVQEHRRDDLTAVHPWIDDAARCGFSAHLGHGPSAPARLDLVGYRQGHAAGRVSTWLPAAADVRFPLPPVALAERVSGVSGETFMLQGLKMFTDLTDQIERFGPSSARRVLDWGCGCGRVTRYLLSRRPCPDVFGCDIDDEAIGWCSANLPSGQFTTIAPAPPTPYADGMFDVIVSCSVFTHLVGDDQRRWLEEMRRILAPGGVLIASTHGEYAFRVARSSGRIRGGAPLRPVPGAAAPPMLTGIEDVRLDSPAGDIRRAWFYRLTYQSRAHTLAEWSQVMEVVHYSECGLDGHQDLVVLRR